LKIDVNNNNIKIIHFDSFNKIELQIDLTISHHLYIDIQFQRNFIESLASYYLIIINEIDKKKAIWLSNYK
jgi:hypothetical protein